MRAMKGLLGDGLEAEKLGICWKPTKASNVSPSNPPPILHLPTELLTSVFAIVADLKEPRTVATLFGLPDGPRTFMKWVKLMLVCWRWREVGLSSSCLWRRISVTRNLESLEFRLSQTVGCTIDLFLRNDAATNESAMPLLLRFASNIRSIQSGDSFCFDALPSIKPLFEVPLPSLESVALLSEQSMWSRFDHDSPDESKGWFDLELSGDLHPCLRKLHIHRILLPPPPAIYSTLRDLAIDLKGLKNPSLSPQDILNVLAHSPHLEALKIFSSPTWAYPSVSQLPADVEPRIQSRCSLPDLREVFLRCPYRLAASILQVVDAPNLAELRVEAFTNTPLVVTEIAPDLLPPSLRHIVPRFSKLRLVPNHPSGFYIGSSASLIPGGRYRSGDRNCFRVDIAVRDSTGTTPSLDAALTTLCIAFAGAPVEQLDIADFDDIASLDAWKRLYTTFPAVASLRLACFTAVVVTFLLDFLTASMEGLWLGLRRLSISTAHKDYEPLDSSELHDIFELVLDILRARRERGASDIVLGLEHELKRLTPLFPHRWMLHTMASLCGGKFTLRRCEDAHRSRNPFEVKLSELFTPAELRQLSWESGNIRNTNVLFDEGEVGEVEDTGGETSTHAKDLPLGDDATVVVGTHADECKKVEYNEYSTLRSKVLEELRQSVFNKTV